MKRRAESNEEEEEDKETTTIEKKGRILTRSYRSFFSLCVAAARGLIRVDNPTPWSRVIHITSKNPLADPSLVLRVFTVLSTYFDLSAPHYDESFSLRFAGKFPLTRHRRAMAAILCSNCLFWSYCPGESHWVMRAELCMDLYHRMSSEEWDHMIMNSPVLFALDDGVAHGLCIRTPNLFARFMETWLSPPNPGKIFCHMSDVQIIYDQFPQLRDTVLCPNLRTVVEKMTRSKAMYRSANWGDIFWIARCLPLLQIVWPMIDLNNIRNYMFEDASEVVTPEGLDWVLRNLPRPTLIQLLGFLESINDKRFMANAEIRQVLHKYQ